MAARKSSRVNRKYKTKYRIRNWREYERGLRSRGDVTIWLSEEAIAAWTPPKNGLRGGQRRYSNLAILTALTLRVVFRLPLRQTEGFLDSLLAPLLFAPLFISRAPRAESGSRTHVSRKANRASNMAGTSGKMNNGAKSSGASSVVAAVPYAAAREEETVSSMHPYSTHANSPYSSASNARGRATMASGPSR